MKLKSRKSNSITLLFAEILLFVWFAFPLALVIRGEVTISTLQQLVWINLLLILIIFLYCITEKNIKNRFSLMAFNISFTILVMGSFLTSIGDNSFWGKHIFSSVSYISLENEAKGLVYIFLSLFSVFSAYQSNSLTKKRDINSLIRNFKSGSELDVNRIRYWSKIFMYIGAIAAFIKTGSMAMYTLRYGYLSTYLVTDAFYQNPLIDLFDKFFLLGLHGYLATFPDRKAIHLPLLLLISYSCLSLLTGQRGTFVINCLFIVWYFMKRDAVKTNEKTLVSKPKLLILIIFGFCLLAFLYNFGYSRVGASSDSTSFLDSALSLIGDQGGSGRLVALSLENRERMLDFISPALMIFWPINNFLINNSIARIFTGGVLGQSANALLNSPRFSSVLTYITNREAYLNGAGLGTCYIAELAASYGAISVILFSFLLGKMFKTIDSITVGNWKKTVFLFYAFTVLIYIPRQATLSIIPESIALLLFILMISVLSKKTKTFQRSKPSSDSEQKT